jgi:hypothetical protein
VSPVSPRYSTSSLDKQLDQSRRAGTLEVTKLKIPGSRPRPAIGYLPVPRCRCPSRDRWWRDSCGHFPADGLGWTMRRLRRAECPENATLSPFGTRRDVRSHDGLTWRWHRHIDTETIDMPQHATALGVLIWKWSREQSIVQTPRLLIPCVLAETLAAIHIMMYTIWVHQSPESGCQLHCWTSSSWHMECRTPKPCGLA